MWEIAALLLHLVPAFDLAYHSSYYCLRIITLMSQFDEYFLNIHIQRSFCLQKIKVHQLVRGDHLWQGGPYMAAVYGPGGGGGGNHI